MVEFSILFFGMIAGFFVRKNKSIDLSCGRFVDIMFCLFFTLIYFLIKFIIRK